MQLCNFSFKKINLHYFLLFFSCWAFLTFLNLHFLIDNEYAKMFFDAQSSGIANSISKMNFTKDPTYFLLQNISATFIEFKVFFGALILLCLMLKFTALLQVNAKPNLLDVAPYFLVLAFLHEGIQIRIAIALSIALWSIIFFVKKRFLFSVLLLIIASSFHITASTFFLVYFLVFLYSNYGKWVIGGGLFITALLASTPIIRNLVLKMGELTNARFLSYSGNDFIKIQNSTGLFEFYIFFVGLLTIFIWKFYIPTNVFWQRLRQIAIASGLLAMAILQVFQFSVVISSRLADLLLLPVLLVLGATLSQLMNEKRYWLLFGTVLFLLIYCFVRSYISFHPGSKFL